MSKDKAVKIIQQMVITVCFIIFAYFIGFANGKKYGELILNNYEYLILKSVSPVPPEFLNSISSEQGLRDSLEIDNIGGISTIGKWHNGIDYAIPDTTPVYAVKGGTVYINYPSFYNGEKWKGHGVYGGLIVIKHDDGTYSLYGHLSRTDLHEGDTVVKGEQIGLSGGVRGRRGSGYSTGPHLHFSYFLNLDKLNNDLLQENLC